MVMRITRLQPLPALNNHKEALMSSITNIYTTDPTDPFIIALQEMPMPELPKDSIWRWGGSDPGWNHTDETKELLREKSLGNTNGRISGYKLSDEFKEKQRQRKLKDNPMNNPEYVEKIRKHALNKKPCPHCGQKMNAGNLSRHIKSRHA